MSTRSEKHKGELIESLCGLAANRLGGAKVARAQSFLRRFYQDVAPEDMLAEDPEDLYGGALTMWTLGRERKPGTAKLRVYNPRFEAHGWQSAHTVIEIVTDDMPFLVDSVNALMSTLNLTVHLVIHPTFQVRRDDGGRLTGMLEAGETAAEATGEAYVHVQVSQQSAGKALAEIEQRLRKTLEDVRAAVEDWAAMRARILSVVETMAGSAPAALADEVEEASAFLRWMEDNHFTFLGYREFDYTGQGSGARMTVVEGSALGILRDPDVAIFTGMRALGSLPEKVRDFLLQPRLLLIMKANRISNVHRPVHLDSIGVMKFDETGRVVGEHRFVGLFTSVAYNQSPTDIPLLRRKVAGILARAGFRPNSHNGKALTNILETHPRDELLQAGEEDLFNAAIGVLRLQERQRMAVFFRGDSFERYVSVVIYMPRERYDTAKRERMERLLSRAFNGSRAAFYARISDSPLAIAHFIIRTTRGAVPDVEQEELRQRLADAVRSWDDKLRQALIETQGEERGGHLFRRFGQGFPTNYPDAQPIPAAVFDIEQMERLSSDRPLAINLSRPIAGEAAALNLKCYHLGAPVPLSDILPMLENMGLKVLSEVPFGIRATEPDATIWIHDFDLVVREGQGGDLDSVRQPFQEAFDAVWNGRAEDDGFNKLVLRAGLTWRQISVLRAYARYLRQAAFTFSQDYMQETLVNHPDLARLLVGLFEARFDPAAAADRAEREAGLAAAFGEALEAVANLDEDRILRRFLNLIEATLRTNYFQPAGDGRVKDYVSFKLDSQAIEDLPRPRPAVEIWVYSPRVEAVHLRGGKVARGGIRWSDRREDFRTEILGLMKAQQVKNAVIVPVGSKGGFVVKRPPEDGGREAQLAEGVECYRIMMRGMLDLTDNIRAGEAVPPPALVRRDGDDPYLVVAADKGTATFSDYANAVSVDEYGFWLGDAFASGGSAGFDHKKMGITARGAWESVKRHFREIGRDIQSEDFTVIGVGDMSGDVFGNGMLLSRHIRLIGAFNHLHVFVDPDPDPAVSWAERKRLFELPRSSWADYDRALIAKGGGIFARNRKSVPVSPEMKALFDIRADAVTPAELIGAMLGAEADLLWFGGIGTYVKASDETHAEVGDRANDSVRADATALRVCVVGEGANLGVTHRARVEYAQGGGRINTDAIDNSAGVDCSDHEVNIKILLGSVIDDGDMTIKQRDNLLEDMKDSVSELVLKDNYDQSQALSMLQMLGRDMLQEQHLLIKQLERGHLRLDRAIEFLPDDEEIAARSEAGLGLTRPELAVILAYAKMELYDKLLESDLPDDQRLSDDLERYFPPRLHSPYREAIARHPLRREIVATYLTNSMINRVGASFLNSACERTGNAAADVARAYIAARDVFDIRGMWARVEALDNKVPADVQTRLLLAIKQLVERGAVWFLGGERQPLDTAAMVAAYADGIAELRNCLETVLCGVLRDALDRMAAAYRRDGVPDPIAWEVASAGVLDSGCDIVRLATRTGQPVTRVAAIYFAVGARFSIDWLRAQAQSIAAESHWQQMAVTAVVDDLSGHQAVLAGAVIAAGEDLPADRAVACWVHDRGDAVGRTLRLIDEVKEMEGLDLAMLAVANGQLRALVAGAGVSAAAA